MTEPFERLVKARRAAGYAKAADAARAMGVGEAGYVHHENGTRKLSRTAERYAAFFRVSIDWLLTGRGEMRARHQAIPVVGLVGAGSAIIPVSDDTVSITPLEEIEMPDPAHLAALEVRGDSQYPRYMDGEIVLYDTRPKALSQLVNGFAVIELSDGRRLLKILRRMPEPGRFRLESHNAPPIDNVEIDAAYAVKGTLDR